MELLTVRLERTSSGSVLAFILGSPHKDRKRKELTKPIIFHSAQNFVSLVILPTHIFTHPHTDCTASI